MSDVADEDKRQVRFKLSQLVAAKVEMDYSDARVVTLRLIVDHAEVEGDSFAQLFKWLDEEHVLLVTLEDS